MQGLLRIGSLTERQKMKLNLPLQRVDSPGVAQQLQTGSIKREASRYEIGAPLQQPDPSVITQIPIVNFRRLNALAQFSQTAPAEFGHSKIIKSYQNSPRDKNPLSSSQADTQQSKIKKSSPSKILTQMPTVSQNSSQILTLEPTNTLSQERGPRFLHKLDQLKESLTIQPYPEDIPDKISYPRQLMKQLQEESMIECRLKKKSENMSSLKLRLQAEQSARLSEKNLGFWRREQAKRKNEKSTKRELLRISYQGLKARVNAQMLHLANAEKKGLSNLASQSQQKRLLYAVTTQQIQHSPNLLKIKIKPSQFLLKSHLNKHNQQGHKSQKMKNNLPEELKKMRLNRILAIEKNNNEQLQQTEKIKSKLAKQEIFLSREGLYKSFSVPNPESTGWSWYSSGSCLPSNPFFKIEKVKKKRKR